MYGGRCSGLVRLKLFSHQRKRHGWHKPNTSHHPKNTIPRVMAASCCGDVFQQSELWNWSELRERWMVLNTGIFVSKVVRYGKLIETYLEQLGAVIATKGSTKALQSVDFRGWIIIHIEFFCYFVLFVVCFTIKTTSKLWAFSVKNIIQILKQSMLIPGCEATHILELTNTKNAKGGEYFCKVLYLMASSP